MRKLCPFKSCSKSKRTARYEGLTPGGMLQHFQSMHPGYVETLFSMDPNDVDGFISDERRQELNELQAKIDRTYAKHFA